MSETQTQRCNDPDFQHMYDHWSVVDLVAVKHSVSLSVRCLFVLQRSSCTDEDKKERFIFNLTVDCGPHQFQTHLTSTLTWTQGVTVIFYTLYPGSKSGYSNMAIVTLLKMRKLTRILQFQLDYFIINYYGWGMVAFFLNGTLTRILGMMWCSAPHIQDLNRSSLNWLHNLR